MSDTGAPSGGGGGSSCCSRSVTLPPCRFRCVLVLARGGEKLTACHGSVEGIMANEPKGAGGFGYDPAFIPDGHCETFGQLPSETKNALSHRARALALLLEHLSTVLPA